jgi:chaperonin GroES
VDIKAGERQLVLVGDRVLCSLEGGESITDAGLILPASVAESQSVQAGRIVAVGPGMAMPPAGFSFDDDWERASAPPRYVAVQARVGDLAVFFRKAAVEVSVDGRKLAIVPHGALLMLLRDGESPARHVS